MKRTIVYAEHEITLSVEFNTGSKVSGEGSVLTNTLSAQIDDELYLIKEDLTADEVIDQIPVVQDQAKARIDIIGTPSDSPLANQLAVLGFEFE